MFALRLAKNSSWLSVDNCKLLIFSSLSISQKFSKYPLSWISILPGVSEHPNWYQATCFYLFLLGKKQKAPVPSNQKTWNCIKDGLVCWCWSSPHRLWSVGSCSLQQATIQNMQISHSHWKGGNQKPLENDQTKLAQPSYNSHWKGSQSALRSGKKHSTGTKKRKEIVFAACLYGGFLNGGTQ